MYQPRRSFSKQEAKNELWRRGVVHTHYLYSFQIPVLKALNSHRFYVLESARRFGKTTVELVRVLELLLKFPKLVWRWCEPWKYQAREIIMPEIEKIQHEIHPSLRLKFHKTDSFYELHNGSLLYLRGVNEDSGESARGTFSHGITADEFGSWNNPEYIVREVLLPQLLTTNGQLNKLSTPPNDLSHMWFDETTAAKAQGRYMIKTIYENKALSKQQIDGMAEAVGGYESAAWKREFLCQPVPDEQKLVIPEFKEEVHVSPHTKKKPYHLSYVGIDLGFNDNTALIFANHDFETNTLLIEDEIIVKAKNSLEIATLAKEKEKDLWADDAPHLRVSDNDLQQIYDLNTLHNYVTVPTKKDDKVAAINTLRLRFNNNEILINPRCHQLIFQLKTGQWNTQKTQFQRGEKLGHLDAIDALIYLHRNINFNKNPYPAKKLTSDLFVYEAQNTEPSGLEYLSNLNGLNTY